MTPTNPTPPLAAANEAWTRAMNAALTYRNVDPEAMDEQDAWAALIDAIGALTASPLVQPAEPVAREEVATLRVSQWPTGREWQVDADEDMLQRLTAGSYRLSVIAVPGLAAPVQATEAATRAQEAGSAVDAFWSGTLSDRNCPA